jgi:ribosomal protein S18 acetylase RimI-like enzyme
MEQPAAAGVPVQATIDDLQAIVAELGEFWGERDVAHLHHALYIHEFGETARVIGDGDGRVLAYLLGFVSPAGIGYVHVVAVRDGSRREGFARRLYEDFASLAHARRASALKAITRLGNGASLSFHRALGFSAREVARYSADGEARIVFERELDSDGKRRAAGARLLEAPDMPVPDPHGLRAELDSQRARRA